MNVGRKIFFDKETGEVILDTGERTGAVLATTAEQDIANYKALSERNRHTFDVLKMEFGAFSSDFANASGYRVNPETKEIEFSYENQEQTDPVYIKPLSVVTQDLKAENEALNLQIIDLWESLLGAGVL